MSVPEPASGTPRQDRAGYGTIVVVGGGCYGSYYIRQLARAAHARRLAWRRLVVVDRDPACAVAHAPGAGGAPAASSPPWEVVVAEWRDFFAAYLGAAADAPATAADDAVVPSPLMPHLMFDWLRDRAAARWPRRVVAARPLPAPPPTPWERAGTDGTHYGSFATWICPVNCVEPARCPHTRGERTWSMPVAIREYATALRARGEPLAGPAILHCTHRAYGVGMFDTADVLDADRLVAAAGTAPGARVLIGTMSHCHGAFGVLAVD